LNGANGSKGAERLHKVKLATGTPTKPRINANTIRELAAILEPTEDEPLDEEQSLAHALLRVVLGEDPSGEGLEDYPSVHRLAKRVLRSKAVAEPEHA
jgi:hypothetical protein